MTTKFSYKNIMLACVFCLQILSGLKTLLGNCPSLEIREAAAQFLGKCGSKDIPEHLEVRKIVLWCIFFCIF